MRALGLWLGLVLSVCAWADMYKWVDREGHTIYSDRPQPGAERIKKQQIQTYTAPKLPALASPQAPGQAKFSGYETIEILHPTQDETIRENTGQMSIATRLAPVLQTELGHKLLFLLDGNPLTDAGTATQLDIDNLDRGTHTVRVAVVDSAGKELASSAPTTFHLLRFSTLLGPARPPSP